MGCINMAYFRFGAPCDGGKGNPDCTEAGQRGLLPLPNLASLTTLVDARYAPAMIYTCSDDGAGGINVTASNVANIPDPYCAPLNGRKPADCEDFEHKPSFRLFHIPAANITLDPFLEETPAGVPIELRLDRHFRLPRARGRSGTAAVVAPEQEEAQVRDGGLAASVCNVACGFRRAIVFGKSKAVACVK